MKDKRLWAWKAVDADLTTRYNFQWPSSGEVSSDDNIVLDNSGPCPTQKGDGLCLAKTFNGAAQRGSPTHIVLVCYYYQDDLLGEDGDKLRVRKCTVVYLWDAWKVLKNGAKADLRWADLRWANLFEADLRGADLRWADLRWADLRWANLR